MTPEQLRARASDEIAELGPEPPDAHDHALWLEERRGAVVLLASLADWDGRRLRQAALELRELTEPELVRLLLDAAERPGVVGSWKSGVGGAHRARRFPSHA